MYGGGKKYDVFPTVHGTCQLCLVATNYGCHLGNSTPKARKDSSR